MSTNPERSVSYVLTKYVTVYMNEDILLLDQSTLTREAARMLRHHETDDIIVLDEKKQPIGIVTDEDILSKVSDVSVLAEATTLKDIMTTPLITINEKATLQEALHKMRDNNIRKLPVISKKNEVLGIIFQSTIAEVIRDATATPSRLLSPPVKAILGNLGFVLQFAGVLLIVPAVLATILSETETATGIYLTTVLLLVTGFFLNSYGEKASLNLHQASILVFSSLFLLTLFGTVPYLYVLSGDSTDVEAFANAFFSSAAGFTTGGISIIDEPEKLPQSFTFYRSFTQLVGGMSFIYLVITAFYPESKLQAMRGFISGAWRRRRASRRSSATRRGAGRAPCSCRMPRHGRSGSAARNPCSTSRPAGRGSVPGSRVPRPGRAAYSRAPCPDAAYRYVVRRSSGVRLPFELRFRPYHHSSAGAARRRLGRQLRFPL